MQKQSMHGVHTPQYTLTLTPHHLPDGSEPSCIVQVRIYTEKLHAEQHKHRQGQGHQCLIPNVSLHTKR